MSQIFDIEHGQGERFLRAKEVCSLLGISKSTLYKFIGEGKFPAPKKLGTRTSVWLSSQVYAVMQAIIGGEAA
ncbi:helix-turn-helix transcriptional regulator [Fundidesulfovibrio terrae]|uniref:helix-turn-helix transcriptional regulator n=1 Tax=Fundidesulfovibrio terrae TaxID=2922866 RepID=UPI001FAFA209|nr:AlpA family phage regulatory protein [Fundidesulfovibrio terrae]